VPYTPKILLKLLIQLRFVVPVDKDGLGAKPQKVQAHGVVARISKKTSLGLDANSMH
jgi:hypothetical protein